MLTAVDQGGAANIGDGFLAVEFQKQLIAHDGTAGGKGERIEPRPGADRRRQRRDVQRIRAFADDLDVIDMRLVADEQFQRGVDLIVTARRAPVSFSISMTRAPRSTTTSERMKLAAGFLRGDEEQMQRPFDGRAGGDPDDRAVAHQRGVERDGDVGLRARVYRGARRACSVAGERFASETTRRPAPAPQCPTIPARRRRRRKPVAARRYRRASAPAFLPRALACRIRRARERLCIAHEARRSVYFQSSTRRSAGLPWRTRRRPPRAAPQSRRRRERRAPARKCCAKAVSAAVLTTFTPPF